MVSTIKGKDVSIILLSIVVSGCFYVLLNFITLLDPQIFSGFFGFDGVFAFLQKQVSTNMMFFYAVFLVIPTTLFLEAIIPVDVQQKLWSFDVTQDFIWLFITKIFHGTFYVWYVVLLADFYDKYFSALTVESLSEMPDLARFVLGVLLVDFLGWFHHLIRHKVPFFWHFHAVHHSQKRMSLFTDFRVHSFDFLIARTLVFVPLFALSFEIPEVIFFLLFNMAFTRFYHGNVRTNLGLLRFILVTPQSHRIHHSIQPEHRDKNFGVFFCIWDRAFGTHFDDGTYPATGIHDEVFPYPKNGSVKEILMTLVGQFTYPFIKIYKSF